MIERNSQDFSSSKGILMFPDHYVAQGQVFAKDHSLAVTVDGRKIVKAGTIFPANDGTAVGVVFSDLDVTDGDQNGAVILHGFINKSKLPAIPASTAIAALPNIVFMPKIATPCTISCVAAAIDVGDASGDVHTVVVTAVGARFRPEAATLTNWTFVGSATNKAAVTAIEISEDGHTATLTVTLSATAVAGSTTAIPVASVMSLGVAPTAAATVATVA